MASITSIKGIGKKTAELLERLEIRTVEDLLQHYPKRYIQHPYPTQIPNLKEIENSKDICILAMPMKPLVSNVTGRFQISSTVLSDGENTIRAVWFNSTYLNHILHPYQFYVFIGKVVFRGGYPTLEHPQFFQKQEYQELAGKLQPVYALTKGITNTFLIKMIEKVQAKEDEMQNKEQDYLPDFILKKYHLILEREAKRKIHFPNHFDEAIRARNRLVFDEFFLFLYCLQKAKEKNIKEKSIYIVRDFKTTDKILRKILPFTLTKAQDMVLSEIYADISSGYIMHRLLQGDVGSGKTVIALAVMLSCVQMGYQAAFMVPTEVLAKQHYKSIIKIIQNVDFPIRICLLTGSMSKKEHLQIYKSIEKHEMDIIIGTHALIQENIRYDNLGLVITDEQHRFGVRQRQTFAHKGGKPHILVMSATPIPRTLAVILYGDMDVSVIDSKPLGRLPIKNVVITESERPKAYKHIQKQLEKGHQAYIICPLIEESEFLDVENVIDYTEKLKKYFNKKFKITYLHGKLSQSQKDQIMEQFSKGEIHILVSTTVIEVGVDVSNATVILIENAERFGLATLHQLRGRVGRSNLQSYCIFVRTSDTESAKKRLEVVGKSNDGFWIAKEDMRLRGPGEIFGMAQSGEMAFEIADIYQDIHILQSAKEVCEEISSMDSMALGEKFQERVAKFQMEQMQKLSL